MRLLRVILAGIDVSLRGQILGTEVVADIGTHHIQGVLAQVGRVGTHVGDVARFIQTLRHHHGLLHPEAQTRTGGLL